MAELNQRTAVILAAGFGSRLAGTVEDISIKPLTPVGGIPLIFRTLEVLKKTGHNHIVVVLGHQNDEIEEAVNEQYGREITVTFTYNDQYEIKHGISVLAAQDYVGDVFTLTMADHILEESLLEKASTHTPPKGGATLLVDYDIDGVFDLDDATKVCSRDNRIKDIGKQISDYNCIDTGVFVCTPGLINELQKIYNENGDVSLSEGVKNLADKNLMHTLDIGDSFWQDVDTPEMLRHAEEKINDGYV